MLRPVDRLGRIGLLRLVERFCESHLRADLIRSLSTIVRSAAQEVLNWHAKAVPVPESPL